MDICIFFMKRPQFSSIVSNRKRGGKRKIPILSQDRMPIYEEDSYSHYSERSSTQTLSQQPQAAPVTSSNLLPMILKKRGPTFPGSIESQASNLQEDSTAKIQEEEGEEEGGTEELLSFLSGANRLGGLGTIVDSPSSEEVRSRIESSKESIRHAMPLLTEDQKLRYGVFKSSTLPRPVMKKVGLVCQAPKSYCYELTATEYIYAFFIFHTNVVDADIFGIPCEYKYGDYWSWSFKSVCRRAG